MPPCATSSRVAGAALLTAWPARAAGS
jgi:hypothetical protein